MQDTDASGNMKVHSESTRDTICILKTLYVLQFMVFYEPFRFCIY